MKKQEKNYISFRYRKEIETDDCISWDCFTDIFGKIDDHPEELKFLGESRWGYQVDVIKIDKVIDILKKLQRNGCNYVEIMFHTDHQNYIFNGLEVTESTPEEIKDHTDEVEKEIEKRGKIEYLYKQIEEIQKEK